MRAAKAPFRWHPVAALAACIAVASAAGCSASSQYMKPTARRAFVPPPSDRASVVFMRPSEFGSAISFQLFDEKKRFVGDALPGTYWEVVVEPGEHWFYALAENTGVMHAELAGGRRYYVMVRPYMGAWSARVELTPLAKRSVDWGKRDEWLRGAEPQAVDQRGGQAELDALGVELDEAMREGRDTWGETDEAWREAHRLRPDDGEGAAQPPPMEPPATARAD